MTTLNPGHNEIFAFETEADRAAFIADLKQADPTVRYAVNVDPDTTEGARYLVAVPTKTRAIDLALASFNGRAPTAH